MNGRDLVELAGMAATHSPVLLLSGGRISVSALEQYWTSSKCRQDRWSRTLRDFQGSSDPGEAAGAVGWLALCPVLEEIILSELLTRVWTAVLSGYDRQRGARDAEPIVRSVLLGHLEARHRTLALLVAGRGIPTEEAVRLNRLRHRVERWTDMLLGRLEPLCDVRDFTFDPERAEDFARGLQAARGDAPGGNLIWNLTLASLHGAFRDLAPETANVDLNARIGQSVLASFPPEMFDGVGLARAVWQTRLANGAADAQGMVGMLLAPEEPRGRDSLEADSRWPREFKARF